MSRKFKLGILGLIAAISIMAVTNGYCKDTIYVKQTYNNISGREIKTVFEDHYGYLWVGTFGGLYRINNGKIFDFTSKENYGSKYHLQGKDIISIVADKKQNVWVNIQGSGFVMFDYSKNNFVTATEFFGTNTLENIGIGDVRQILFDQKNNLWICAPTQVYHFNQQNNKLTNYDIERSPDDMPVNFNCLYESSDGTIYLGAMNGLHSFNSKLDKFETVPLADHPVRMIRVMKEDSKGILWVGTEKDGLWQYDKTQSKAERLVLEGETGRIKDLTIDKFDRVWATSGALFLIENKQQRSPIELGISTAQNAGIPGRLYSLPSGRLVVVMDNLLIFSPESKKFYAHKVIDQQFDSPSDITGIIQAKNGRIYTASGEFGGFVSRPLTNRRFESNSLYNQMTRKTSLCIFEYDENTILMGTYKRGLEKYNIRTKSSELLIPSDTLSNGIIKRNDDVRCIFRTSDGQIWIGTNEVGLFHYNPKTNRFTWHDVKGIAGALTIAEDNNNNLWIGSYYGLGIYNYKTKTSKAFILNNVSDSTSLSHNWISDILFDSRGKIWVGTTGGGINIFNKNDSTFSIINENSGLCNNNICALIEDSHGQVWASTKKGLSQIDKDGVVIANYFVEDGLVIDSFKERSAALTSTGDLLFGTFKGFVHFNPRNISNKARKVKTFYTEFKAMDHRFPDDHFLHYMPGDKMIEVAYGYSTIKIDFETILFTNAKKILYQAKLEGYDLDWEHIGSDNHVFFTKLPKGVYTLHLKVSPDGLLWTEGPEITFRVLPPLWLSWWFLLITSTVILIITLMIIKLRTNFIHRQKEKLTHLVELRTRELEKANQELRSSNREIEKQKEDIVRKNIELEITQSEVDKANEALRSLNNSLEKIVQKRTMRLEKVNKELDRFVYSASHELISPLKSLNGVITLLKNDDNPEAKSAYVTHLIKSTKRMENLINNLLSFSRNSKSEIQYTGIQLFDLVEDIFDNYSKNENGVQLINEVGKDVIVVSDAGRLKLVVENLVSNAIKYFDSQKENSFVKVSYALQNGNYIIQISDNGIGIKKDHIKQIFEMYFRATSQADGSGLGLYIVMEILSRIDGKIEVESVFGEGSHFKLVMAKQPTKVESDND